MHGTGTVRKDKTVVGGLWRLHLSASALGANCTHVKQRPTKPVILTGSANWYSFAGEIKRWEMFTSAGWQVKLYDPI